MDRRVLAALAITDASNFKIAYSGAKAPKVSFTQALAVARAMAALLPGARALRGADFQTASEAPTADTATDVAELADRAGKARDALLDARAQLLAANTSLDISAALVVAATFSDDLFPSPAPNADSVNHALDDLARRIDRAEAVAPKSSTAPLSLDQARELLAAVFGADFVAIPSLGVPPGAGELAQSLASDTLISDAPNAPAQVLQQTARVRDGVGRWRKLNLLAGALGAGRPDLHVAQLPHVPGGTWAGGPFTAGPPERGRLSLLLLTPASAPALDPTSSWRGLLLDDWIEIAPAAVETTGLSFHYDGPNSEAGNAVLVAVPSGLATHWSFAELLATAEETLDLMQMRAIDPGRVGLGQILPAIYLPVNLNKDAPSSPMDGSFANDVVLHGVDI